MDKKNKIMIRAADVTITRGKAPQEVEVKVLAENVNLFLSRMEQVLEKAPADIGSFQFTEFQIAVEVSAKGQLILLGSGVESSAKGGLTFKFQRKLS